MKKLTLSILILIFFISCETKKSVLVSNATELEESLSNAQPGTEIVMANGEWNDVRIKFFGKGTESQPIALRAETPGEVIIQGESDLRLGGKYLVVDGLYFTNGASPSQAVIQFSINDDTLAFNARVTNCVIEDFNKSQRNKQDLWVRFKGRNNQLDHCYLAGKSNRGPTIRVDLEGNESIKNYHKINNNHFGPRPPKGGPSAETIQIGNSSTSMAPSYTQVYDNLFDRCDGEVEVISSKSNFNEFRNNVFYKSEGSLVTRHGNYCTVDGNYFIGDENSPHVGGIRLIGTGHWVTNNYFYNLRGEIFRAPLAVMNGIPKSPLNRYIQVTDVVVAYNTWVNCKSPWQFGVGSNVDQKDVLPPSEIRSETPERTLVANNVIYNDKGDQQPIVQHDRINGIEFKSNVINNQSVDFEGVEGLIEKDFSVTEVEDNVWVPLTVLNEIETHYGFEFDQIEKDLFGNVRDDNDMVGATTSDASPGIMDLSKYGPDWFEAKQEPKEPQILSVRTSDELIQAVANASNGDIIELVADNYDIGSSLIIDKKLTIRSADSVARSTITYLGTAETPAFEMNPGAELVLQAVFLTGSGKNYAFASLKENMSSLYNLKVVDSEISNFDYVLKAYKYSFSEFIKIKNSVIKNCNSGLELSAEDDDRGDYNAENVYILDSQFDDVKRNVVDYYRGGYDESTVGGNLVVQGCTFTNSGADEENGILLNTYGIINVDISNNTFRNNDVKLVARLWGAKNNSHADNVIENSGELIVEQNLPLKLMY
ncbi:chondroitinase-B domain-containing protein [Ekhidna sp.]|uniref:chondroitinase-B domain-containing protein n=1 Tax=Ekhidna sp. TaxID=2608089 RepID=UPI003C7D3C1B